MARPRRAIPLAEQVVRKATPRHASCLPLCTPPTHSITLSRSMGETISYGLALWRPRLTDGRGELRGQTDELGLPRGAGLVEDVCQVGAHGRHRNAERVGGLHRGLAGEQTL